MRLTKVQARRFLLHCHGLLGEHIFHGKDGIMTFFGRTGCIQYDPVNVCGKNADIVLHSRIGGYEKSHLDELLYKDRVLIDYFDKNLCILPIEVFPVFLQEKLSGGYAEAYARQGGEAVRQIEPLIRQLIDERGHISAREVNIDKNVDWFWGVPTSLPRAALETMYFRGEFIIHHKTGTNKSYAFTKDHVPADILGAPMPYNTEEERLAWHVKRRIAAVGMLWNKAGDAWLGLRLKASERAVAFAKLLTDGEIFEVSVDGIGSLYICESDREILEYVLSQEVFAPRTEFIAPLDNLIWDRKLIAALFNFQYKWEIYTPADKRIYGAYTLPILHGDALVGRIDAARRAKELVVNNIWMEDGKLPASELKTAIEDCVRRFAEFNYG